jgi:hypothetical protein
MNELQVGGLMYAAVVALLLCLNWWLGRTVVGRAVRDMPGARLNGRGTGAGARVGSLERVLVFLLILVGQWGVIGFVIAAKSIARFKELEDKAFTDYYLAGTFTSILFATVTGLIAVWMRSVLIRV